MMDPRKEIQMAKNGSSGHDGARDFESLNKMMRLSRVDRIIARPIVSYLVIPALIGLALLFASYLVDVFSPHHQLLYAISSRLSQGERKEYVTKIAVRNMGRQPLSDVTVVVSVSEGDVALANAMKRPDLIVNDGDGVLTVMKKGLPKDSGFMIVLTSNSPIEAQGVDVASLEVLGIRGAFIKTSPDMEAWFSRHKNDVLVMALVLLLWGVWILACRVLVSGVKCKIIERVKKLVDDKDMPLDTYERAFIGAITLGVVRYLAEKRNSDDANESEDVGRDGSEVEDE
jgi:hypothetical protein